MEDKIKDINLISMQIILNAGDARQFIMLALDDISEQRFDQAGEKLNEAQEKIKIAHTNQTMVIQDEARGIACPRSLLFAHAQDTLMTIYTELNLAKKLITIFKKLDERLVRMEK